MSRFNLSSFFLFILFSIFLSCNKNPEIALELDNGNLATRSYTNVEEALWIYFQEFEEEAKKRGFNIDLIGEGQSGEINSIEQEHVAGICQYSSNNPNHIIIDEDFFNSSNDLIREFIIFHELGHCVLGREHREDAHTDGTCKSIMRSGLEECKDQYNANTRKKYLDELFKPSEF